MSDKGWSTGRIVAMIATSIVALIGVGLGLAGAAMLVVDGPVRGDDGFINSPSERLEARGYAITTEDLDLSTDPAGWAPSDVIGTIRITVEGERGGGTFLGVAPADKLEAYLRRVAHSRLDEIHNGNPRYTDLPGTRPPGPPRAQDFWVAFSSGEGEQAVDWDAESGVWSLAVMNADGSRGVAVEAKAGVELDWLGWVGLGFLVAGLVLTIGSIVLVIVIANGASKRAAATKPPPSAGPPAPPDSVQV